MPDSSRGPAIADVCCCLTSLLHAHQQGPGLPQTPCPCTCTALGFSPWTLHAQISQQVAREHVLRELARIIDPDFGQDIVACGFVKDLAADAGSGRVSFALELTTPACPIKDEFERKARNYVAALDWVTQVGLVGPLACMRATTSSAPRFGALPARMEPASSIESPRAGQRH